MDEHEALGLASGTVRVVPYDPGWPKLFQAEVLRIRDALGDLPLDIEHIGSTAVPGLAAKPVLDILAGYPSEERLDDYIAALTRAGYMYRGEQGIPGRHFFRRGDPRSYHVHLTRRDGAFWREHLAFRDALRDDPGLRDAYGALKLDLARRYPENRKAYINGKTTFVLAVVRKALKGIYQGD